MTQPAFPDDYYVIDVGMHDGADSEYYARRGFRVIAFEANPALAEAGRQHFASLGLPVEVRNRAIAEVAGEQVSFFVNRRNSAWSSLDTTLGNRAGGSDAVEVTTTDIARELHDICDRIHMVKIDIEGFDLTALRQLATLPARPAYCSVENGGTAFLETFVHMGYTRFKLSNQKYNALLKVPVGSPHGYPVDWSFRRHSSGPFGDDIPAPWIDADKMHVVLTGLEAGRRTVSVPNLWADAIGWFDMHAAR